ncbi:hypothetical protein [Clostridium isatidis]|uniref:Uncharacterized protein n=1 Tax=Clostridium isatidis TaxID=182773 RepID=A0A343J959_9CLOT|nr:hypothetical protein [Clostridium isatidis]ASW42067.1 hypothetical protein BEN51_00655 [Clostridium isatidis]
MEYLPLKAGNLITILVPINLIFSKIIEFIKRYKNKKVENVFRVFTLVFGIGSTAIFYILDYSMYFCFTWIGSLLIGLLQYSIVYRNVEKESNEEINELQKLFSFFSIILGIFIIIIPHTKIFNLIGGGIDSKVDSISKIVFAILGICHIILNEYILSKIQTCLSKNC